MNTMLTEDVLWAVAVMLVVPIVILGASELEERLRQADSPLRGPVLTLRNWVLPFFAAWALLTPVLGIDPDAWYLRVVSTGLIVSVSVAAWQVLRLVGDGILSRSSKEGRRPVPRLVLAFPRLALILGAGALIVAGVWGVDLSAALTALGVTSLVVSFALQDTLSGLASGVLLLSDRPFKPGDWITSDGGQTEGEVVDINWRTTRIRDRNGDMVVVPNSTLAGANVVNYSAPHPLHRVVVSLQVAFANPPTLAKDMLLDAARSVPGVLLDPAPAVLVTAIDDPLMGYDVHLWVDDYAIVPRVRSDFGALVWYQSRRHDVPLPSPAQDIFIHDPVAEARAAEPTLAELRDALCSSPLLAQLPDNDLDRLVGGARLARFRAGELMVDSSAENRDLLVVIDGAAQFVLLEPGFDEATVGDVGSGDIVGLLDARRGDDRIVAVRASTDCDVVVLSGDVVSEVGSRNAEMVDAFNRLVTQRRRRVTRLIERRELALAARPATLETP
jgi:small-conductance mechanosensitive channel